MSCPLCGRRKGKRSCPAKSERICSSCCGSKRRVEIPCPDDCVYLTGAHAAGWEGRETERNRDIRRVAPHIQQLSDKQAQLFLGTLVGLTGLCERTRGLDDKLLAEALATYTKTLETRDRGVIYEHQADDLRVQGLVTDLCALFEPKDEEGRSKGPKDQDLLAILQALGRCLEATIRELEGPTAFLDSIGRLASQIMKSQQAETAEQAPSARIIQP